MDISTPFRVLKAYNEPLWDDNDFKLQIEIRGAAAQTNERTNSSSAPRNQRRQRQKTERGGSRFGDDDVAEIDGALV